MPVHQRVQKRLRKIQSIQNKRRICRKRAWRQEKKCGKSEKKLTGRRSASHCCWTKVEKTQWHAEMEAELQGLQAGEERRGSNASQTGDCCLEAFWQQIAAVCAAVVQSRSMPWPMRSSKGSRKVEQFRSRCQEEMKEEKR